MNFCPNCGAKNEDPAATFCSNCGFKFAGKEDIESTEATPEKENILSRDIDTPKDSDASFPTLERPSFEEPEDKEDSIVENDLSSKKNISAYDDDVDSSEDIFIVPKGSRASRPLAQRPRAEREHSSVFDEGAGNFPDIFSEEEATSMFAASHKESESFAPFGDAGGDPETDNLVSSRVEEIKQQRNRQEQAAAARASQGDLFAEDFDSVEESTSSSSQSSRPQYPRAQRPQNSRASRPQKDSRDIFQQSNSSRYSEPTQVMHASPAFEEEDDTYNYEEAPVQTKKKRASSSGSNLPKIILPIVIILVIIGGFLGFKMSNTPKKAIDSFITAVEAKDVATLKKITRLDNIPTATDANWLALCNGLTQENGTTTLRAQLTDQITNPKNVDNAFPAVRLVTKTTLGIFKTYKVAATGINLTVPGAQAGTVLKLDDVSYTGATSTESSDLLYSNIMPGLYNCQLVGPNGSTTEGFAITLFTNNTWSGAPLPDGNAAPSDSGTTTEGGSETTTSSVPSSSEIDNILSSFYSSYLTCINNQSTSSLTNATDTMKTEVGELMQKSGNKSNKFDYVSASCDASTISADDDSNPTKITVNATFNYKYTPRDGGTTESGDSTKKMELINVNGTWVVNSMQNS